MVYLQLLTVISQVPGTAPEPRSGGELPLSLPGWGAVTGQTAERLE